MPSVVDPDVDPDLVRFLQTMLPGWLKIDTEATRGQRAREGMISKRQASAKLGLSSAGITNFLKDGRGVGMKCLDAVAKLRYGKVDVTRLREEAKAWAQTHPVGQPFVIPVDLDRVLLFAEQHGHSVADARRVAHGLAAFTGTMTDEELARRFGPSKRKEGTTNTIVSDEDDLGDGIGGSRAKEKKRR